MSYVKVNNYRSLDGLMKEILNEFPSTVSKAVREDVLNYPPVNIVEQKDIYSVELSVPGFEKTDFNIKLDGKVLTVSTEKKEGALSEGEKSVRKEFSLKSFKRSFTVDEKIDADNISARYENGILKLQLPKKEVTAATKDINIL